MISRRQRWSCPVSANKPVRERSEQVKVITSSSSLADLHSQIPPVGLLEQLRCSSSRLGIIHETRNTWRARRLLHPRRSDSLSYFVFNQQCQFLVRWIIYSLVVVVEEGVVITGLVWRFTFPLSWATTQKLWWLCDLVLEEPERPRDGPISISNDSSRKSVVNQLSGGFVDTPKQAFVRQNRIPPLIAFCSISIISLLFHWGRTAHLSPSR